MYSETELRVEKSKQIIFSWQITTLPFLANFFNQFQDSVIALRTKNEDITEMSWSKELVEAVLKAKIARMDKLYNANFFDSEAIMR